MIYVTSTINKRPHFYFLFSTYLIWLLFLNVFIKITKHVYHNIVLVLLT